MISCLVHGGYINTCTTLPRCKPPCKCSVKYFPRLVTIQHNQLFQSIGLNPFTVTSIASFEHCILYMSITSAAFARRKAWLLLDSMRCLFLSKVGVQRRDAWKESDRQAYDAVSSSMFWCALLGRSRISPWYDIGIALVSSRHESQSASWSMNDEFVTHSTMALVWM